MAWHAMSFKPSNYSPRSTPVQTCRAILQKAAKQDWAVEALEQFLQKQSAPEAFSTTFLAVWRVERAKVHEALRKASVSASDSAYNTRSHLCGMHRAVLRLYRVAACV